MTATPARARARAGPEPALWLLFSAGGVAAALFLPALLFLFGLALPLGWVDTPERNRLLGLVGQPVVSAVLFVVLVLSLFHWAQRFRYTLFDGLKLGRHRLLISIVCYSLAVLGSVAAAIVLWQLP